MCREIAGEWVIICGALQIPFVNQMAQRTCASAAWLNQLISISGSAKLAGK